MQYGEVSRFLVFYSVVTLIVIAFQWQTAYSLAELWWDSPTYGHGILVLPVSIYLFISNRGRIQAAKLQPSYLGAVFFLALNLVWALAFLIDIKIVLQVLLVIMLAALFWAMGGLSGTRVVIFPLLYPLVAVPAWDPLEPILQQLSAHAVSKLLVLFGVPVYLEGNLISIPEGRFYINDVCAGLRYVLAAMAIGVLYAFQLLRKRSSRIYMCLFSLVLALVVNWVRIFIVILAGHLTQMEHYLVKSHVGFGWMLFAISLVFLFWFGSNLQKKDVRGRESISEDPLPMVKWGNSARYMIVVVLLLSFSLSVFASYAKNWQGSAISISHLAVPEYWKEQVPSYSLGATFIGASQQWEKRYREGEDNWGLLLARYNRQTQGSELIYYENRFFGETWQPVSSTVKKITIGGRDYGIAEQQLRHSDGRELLAWHWYQVSGVQTASPLKAKLLQILSYFRTDTAANAISLYVSTSSESASQGREQLQKRLEQLQPFIATL